MKISDYILEEAERYANEKKLKEYLVIDNTIDAYIVRRMKSADEANNLLLDVHRELFKETICTTGSHGLKTTIPDYLRKNGLI